MNILYITNKPIYPIVDGGCFAMDSFLRSLIRFATVKHLTVATHKHPFNRSNYPLDIANKTQPEGSFILTKTNFFNLFKAIITNQSYNASRFYNEEFSSKIKTNIQQNSYDCILLESAYLLVYTTALKSVFKGKIILRAPNVEYKIWEDYTRFSRSFLQRTMYRYLTAQLKHFELSAIRKIDHILAITENDSAQFKKDGIDVPIDVVPFGIEEIASIPPEILPSKIFFLGAYNWKPNLDAALFLINEIVPELIKIHPNLELHLAGTFMPNSLLAHASKHIITHGKVTSSSDFILNHGILVAPIFSGSGVRIKIVEALSQGIPVVASSIAM